MAAIYIGAPAIDRSGAREMNPDTFVGKEGSADGTGKITSVEMWFAIQGANVEVATFIDEGGNVLSTRDYETIGTVTAGSKQTFSGLDMAVETGDYLGVAGTAGQIEQTPSGEGLWHATSDQIPCSSVTFDLFSSGKTLSLYGTGEGAGWSHKFLGVSNASIGKINGIAIADILKVNGVE